LLHVRILSIKFATFSNRKSKPAFISTINIKHSQKRLFFPKGDYSPDKRLFITL